MDAKEGDRMSETALETILKAIEYSKFPLIVKEVGQGTASLVFYLYFITNLVAIGIWCFEGQIFQN